MKFVSTRFCLPHCFQREAFSRVLRPILPLPSEEVKLANRVLIQNSMLQEINQPLKLYRLEHKFSHYDLKHI